MKADFDRIVDKNVLDIKRSQSFNIALTLAVVNTSFMLFILNYSLSSGNIVNSIMMTYMVAILFGFTIRKYRESLRYIMDIKNLKAR